MNEDIRQLGRWRIDSEMGRLHAKVDRLSAKVERLRGALERIADDAVPRAVHVSFRKDKIPNKNDKCSHGRPMWDDCTGCVSEYAKARLQEEDQEK